MRSPTVFMRRAVAVAAVTICVMLCLPTTRADDLRKLGGIGNVLGGVVDADTGAPIDGARVTFVEPFDCRKVDGDTAQTGIDGGYIIRAPIGQVTSKFATGRLLSLSAASILFGGAQKKDYFVNVSRLWISIDKEGYKPFSGPVDIYASVPVDFEVVLQPIELAPASAPYRSTVEPYTSSGQLLQGTSDTYLLDPGDNVNCMIKTPLVLSVSKRRGGCQCSLSLGDNVFGERFAYPTSKSGPILYGYHCGTRKNMRPAIYGAYYLLLEDIKTWNYAAAGGPTYYAFGVDPDKKTATSKLIDQLNSPLSIEDKDKLFDNLIALRPFGADVSTLYEMKAENLMFSSPKLAVAAYANVDPKDHTKAADKILSTVLVGDNSVPTNPPEMTPKTHLLVAESLAKAKKFSAAIAELQPLVSDPQFSCQARSGIANVHFLEGHFELALSEYSSLFPLNDLSGLSDFPAAHNYAILLFKANQIPDAITVFEVALKHARNAGNDASAAAATGLVGTNMFSVFTGPQVSVSAGFSYPEAASDFLIVNNVDALGHEDDPNYAHQAIMLGRALGESGLPNEGITVLNKFLAATPNDENALSALAVDQLGSGQRGKAAKTINALLDVNPRNSEGLRLKALLNTQGTVISSNWTAPVK